MGIQLTVQCRKCGCKFGARLGGGFVFHLLHCDTCGEDKSITFEELGEAHLRYLKGLKGPYCVATGEHDRFVQENYPGDPLPEEDYHKIIDSVAGECKCGGHFRMDANPRCPQCNSDDIEKTDDVFLCYD